VVCKCKNCSTSNSWLIWYQVWNKHTKNQSGRISGITFIRYAQNRKIGKSNNLKALGTNKIKDPKRDSKNRYGHPFLREAQVTYVWERLRLSMSERLRLPMSERSSGYRCLREAEVTYVWERLRLTMSERGSGYLCLRDAEVNYVWERLRLPMSERGWG
jgi:hypothetical protein